MTKELISNQVHISFQPGFNGRQSVALEALATVLKVSPTEVSPCQAAVQSDNGVNVDLPVRAVARLRTLMQNNNGQLRLLGLKNVILEGEPGTIEKWCVSNGRFDLETSAAAVETFEPVPRIWLYHVIYLVVTVLLAASIVRFSTLVAASLLLISAICVAGIGLARRRRYLAAHLLAVAIGLGAPLVVCARLLPLQTLLLFLALILGTYIFRRTLV